MSEDVTCKQGNPEENMSLLFTFHWQKLDMDLTELRGQGSEFAREPRKK